MDLEKIMNERHELLIRMRGSFQEELVAAEISESENEGEPDIL